MTDADLPLEGLPMTDADLPLEGLPGSELVVPGLADLRENRITVNALLVLIGSPNLVRLGIDVPRQTGVVPPYEHRLYDVLCAEHGISAYSRYNSLIRRLVSFERALALLRRTHR